MYAVLCGPRYWSSIQQAVSSMGEQVLYHSVDDAMDIAAELNTASRLALRHLIVDISTVDDHKRLIHALIQYKIMNDKTQIIIIAPGLEPGAEVMNQLVTQVHVYDIVVPGEDEDLVSKIRECVTNPGTYKKGVKWLVDGDPMEERKERGEAHAEVEEGRVIVRKQLVGKVIIGLAGTHHRVGVTHLSLSLANFLRRRGFSVALLQLEPSQDTNRFLSSYDDTEAKDGFSTLKGVDYYPYREDFNITVPYRRNYDFFVLDAGVYGQNRASVDEYERANVKAIVSTAREWEIAYLEKFIKGVESDQYDYIISFADDILFNYITGNINAGGVKYKLFKALAESDLVEGQGLDPLFESWLSRFVATQVKPGEKQGFLKRLFKK